MLDIFQGNLQIHPNPNPRVLYFYEHVSGSIHMFPEIVVDLSGGPDKYFDSPYIKRWWKEERKPEEHA